jgi:hypothetical protein
MQHKMTRLLELPPELISRIVNFVAVDGCPEPDSDDDDDDDEPFNHGCKTKYDLANYPSASGLSYQHILLATTPRPDIPSLSNLRLASTAFSQMCTKHMFTCVRLLPTEKSALHYNHILSTPVLSQQVRKVVFQTRMVPGGSNSCYARQHPGPGDHYHKPHDFFMDALEQVGRFPRLTHVEMVFGSPCVSPDSFSEATEDVDFREEILMAFYAGLNHCEHPANKVFDLSIKNLQDYTPQALIASKDDEDIKFKENFEQVMSRITHLSLQIATEDNEAAPDQTLDIVESHTFFGHELQEYWIAPIAENLVYFKLYANEMLFGLFPACNLPRLPKLRTLIFGNLSIGNDDHINWILSHANTLEELIFDDAVVAVGASLRPQIADFDNRRVIYSPLIFDDGRPVYRSKTDYYGPKQQWLWPTRWHHILGRLQRGLPKLRHFVIGHGNWDDNEAFDEAEILQSRMNDARYQYLDRGVGPDNWLGVDEDERAINKWTRDGKVALHRLDCNEEDWKALKEFLDELKRRR